MRIVVNDIAASTGGAMTVLRDFYACVCENDHENEWIFLLGEKYFPETENVKIIALPEIKKSKKKKLLFDFVTGRRYIHKLKPDAVLSMQNIITFGLKVPQAVYIHQSIPFQTVKQFSFLRSSERKLAVIQHLIGGIIKLSAKKSDLVIVQTQWMKDAVYKMCRLSQGKVLVSLPTVGEAAQTDAAFDPAQFFYPTAKAIYKNNACLFAASKLLDEQKIPHQVTMTLPAEKSIGSVTCVGRLPYEEVQVRYKQGTLVFPSYIETFGYPLAEARRAGTVVLASDTPFSREVLAGYENAYFFDPFKPDQLAVLMMQVLSGKITRNDTKTEEGSTGGWQAVAEAVLTLGE